MLVADDHPTNRKLLRRQIESLGYAVETAEDGVQALEKWHSGRFFLVITDCNMPEMDGYALARAIREAESRASGRRRTAIIACTANALGSEAENCFAAGMDAYLVKPVELMQLVKKLDQWLPIPDAAAVEASYPCVAAPATSADAPLDRAILAAVIGGDAAAERAVLQDFRRTNDEDAASLAHALAERDPAQAARACHRIKGAGRMIGANGLASACERLEQASRAGDWPAAQAVMDRFEQEQQRLYTYIDALSLTAGTSAMSGNLDPSAEETCESTCIRPAYLS